MFFDLHLLDGKLCRKFAAMKEILGSRMQMLDAGMLLSMIRGRVTGLGESFSSVRGSIVEVLKQWHP